MNIAQLLTQTAAQRGGHPALIFQGRTFCYEEIDRLSDRFANVLEAAGAGRGGVIAINLETCPELVIAYHGALKAGVVPNVINAFLKPEEVQHVVADSGATLLVTDPGRWGDLAPFRPSLGLSRVLVTGDARVEAADRFDEAISTASDRFGTVDCDPGALASLLYTSGTTGHPKGVMLSHRNVIDNALQFAKVHYGPDDRLLIAAPLFHCWGLINGVLATFAAGGTAVIIPRFRIETVLELIESMRPSIMLGVPAMVGYLSKSPLRRKRDLSSLRFVLSAAAPLPVELIEALRRDWGVGYAESYGLTETSPVITTTPHAESRPGSCGRAMGDTVLKVADPDGNELPIGEVGELWARGTAISGGYYRRPDATAEVFTDDGWFRTGDIVRLDEGGYLYIVDRVKDMINVGGEKVYPRDVEEVLHRHEAVADAVVVGIPDADLGEVVKAFIALRPGCSWSTGEAIEFLRPTVASFKVPRVVEFVDSIPRSASGKALRRLLRG